LGNLFVTFRVPGTWVLILFTYELDKTGKIMLLFSFFCQSRIWKVPCDIFVLHEMSIYRIKGKILLGLPIGIRYAWVSCASYSNRLFC